MPSRIQVLHGLKLPERNEMGCYQYETTYLEKSWSYAFGSCYAKNRLCDALDTSLDVTYRYPLLKTIGE